MNQQAVYLIDHWSRDDYLEFSDFKPALQRILLTADTPLTLGIYGPWGSGKTSLLRMLHDAIEAQGWPYVRPVWFTAWKYDHHPSLWRAFMLRVIDALYPRENEPRDQPRHQRPRLLNPTDSTQKKQIALLDQLETSVYQPVDWQEMGRWMVDWLQMGQAGLGLAAEVVKVFIPGAGLAAELLAAGKQLAPDDRALLKRHIHTAQRQQLLEREQFEDAFAEAIASLLGTDGQRGRLIVFVDDLDRCLPEKAVQVLEAIKLFLSAPGTVFVLGMDREVIQRGIEAHYRIYGASDGDAPRPELPIRGDNYLQKLVQIPFHLPPLSLSSLESFLTQVETESRLQLSEVTRGVLARGLFPNPRQAKQALNIFQLLREVAEARRTRPDAQGRARLAADAIADPLLAKTVIIQTQYPQLYQDWRRYPTLVRTLEEEVVRRPLSEQERLRGWVQPAETPDEAGPAGGGTRRGGLIETYLGHREEYALLERMLGYPEAITTDGERGRFQGLTADQMAVYVHLAGSLSAEPAPVASVTGVDLEALLSNDWAKVQDAMERLPAEIQHKPDALRRHLAQVLADPAAPPAQRASAGDALGLLGDPRPGVRSLEPDLIPITTGLRFRMGEQTLTQVTIAQPYAIGRYPVTNAQFRFFVEDGGYTEKRWLETCWTEAGRAYREEYDVKTPHFWDDARLKLDNLPVVGVSWYEALAYVRWLARKTGKPYRLPTEAEWERAARFTDGRVYPWGDDWREGVCNTQETGLDRPVAVGCFPAGASVEGAHDLSGNVWEWCQTRWQDENGREYSPPYRADDGREELEGEMPRVLRGGSCYDNASAARCGARDRLYPYHWDYNWGFRVVLSPLPSLSSGTSDL